MDNTKSLYCCRVCGLFQYGDLPWGLDGHSPSFNICDCCGVEFGYEDCFPKDVKRFREEWLKQGGFWLYPEEKPLEWSLEEQLQNISKEYL